ncbi:type VI secretion system tip protein VgrG [Pleionea sp. CnH1-48]|uniref:type VI secretion system tip protein VgrG n=1 Tax=Pleionea sp. CnH1-48 TaxID=2954494 RepID=UPI0020978ACB|nr:type VI secretion system tip protein VgrG [Pleionea sp. CnH1-48]MCO7226558.1 type VI secretion system tip protein VgrG [Pleionea sp. CnH1-48]
MADSPELNSTGVVKLSLLSDGSPVSDDIDIVSVETCHRINKISRATIVVLDGEMADQSFAISDGDDLKPGKKITIKAGYGDDETQIYEGIVIKHGVSISGDNYSRLSIECRDAAVATTIGRKNANYVDMKDSDILSQIIGNYSTLTADVTATTVQYGELVQYNASDWDFILTRAEANGLLVMVTDGTVAIKSPADTSDDVLTVTYGEDIIEFSAKVDAMSQYTEVKGISWDMSSQAIVEEPISQQTLNSQGNLSASDLADIIGLDSYRLQTSTPLESGALKDWATGQQRKSALSKIVGHIKFQGSAKATLGSLIELKGVGERFNGSVFVSGVRHSISDGSWFTEVDFGLSAELFAEKRDIPAPLTNGFLPGIEGLHIGVVKQLDQDPNGEYRIQVSVPVLQAETEGVWARLIQFYASQGFGLFFIPEIGDEVILGYLNNDPAHPIILGSVYSSNHKAAYDLTADNFTKALVTKSGHTVEFDDDKQIITIKTPDGNSLIFNDDEKSISLTDVNDNSMVLNSDGITLDSPKDIKISAKGEVSVDAVGKISMTSQQDVTVEGLNVSHTANVGFTAKGNATAEVSASGQTTIKGAMVMIN